jgi:hypothetical protein
MITTRREFNKLALTALPAMGLTASPFAKPNSKFGGVQVGIIAPYSFRGLPSSADDLLKYLVQLGINVVEMQSEPVEAYAGAPAQGRGPGGRPPGAGQGLPPGASPPASGGRPPMSPEQQAARQARAEELRKWRLSAPMEKYKALAKQYKDAGVTIHIVKFGLNTNMPDEKDRKINQGPNMPWGQGDTQIREILQLMKKEKYTFPACIELEYPPPEGSDVMKELAKCVQYCKDALA